MTIAADPQIHPLAVVEPGATIGAGCKVGPFCTVGPEVVLEKNVELISHVSIMGATTVGEGCRIFPGAVLGADPQNLKHRGGRSTLSVGRNCVIREAVTLHRGTDVSRGATAIGDDCYFMAYSHVAHDCVVGNNVTMANGATLGGHCEIGDRVSIGGLTAVHQFVRIGERAFVGGGSAVVGDIIPYAIAVGNRAKLRGFNIIGLRRAGMDKAEIHRMRAAYRAIFNPARPVAENLEAAARDYSDSPSVRAILDFMSSRGKRHFTVPPLANGGDDGQDEAA